MSVGEPTTTNADAGDPAAEAVVDLAGGEPATFLDAMLDVDHLRKAAAADWARTHLRSRTASFDRARWRAAASAGVLGLRTPVALGGSGRSAVDSLLTLEGLGLGTDDAGLVFALASQVFAMQTALVESGTPDQQSTWLPRLCSGDAIGCFAMTEPDTGSDTAAITTTAVPLAGGSFRIDGEKAWVTLGPVADVVIVFASTDSTKGRWGITAFLVPLDTPGVVVGEVETKSGLHSCPFGRIRFDGCVVGADAVMGKPGAGSAIFTSAVEAERAFLYAAQLGAMERTMEAAVHRARSREQFGRPIGQFQAVSHRIADMKLRHEASRLLVYKAAALHDRGASVTMAAALAKLQTSESAITSAVDAIRIHGAEGYTEAAGVEMDLRDAVGGLAYSGTSDIQRNIVARMLGVERPVRSST
jgi:alkylation response protein AidB-like acyl-CoA dehydrogenase